MTQSQRHPPRPIEQKGGPPTRAVLLFLFACFNAPIAPYADAASVCSITRNVFPSSTDATAPSRYVT